MAVVDTEAEARALELYGIKPIMRTFSTVRNRENAISIGAQLGHSGSVYANAIALMASRRKTHSRRFRWYNPATWWPYLTTRGPSPLGWTATSAQCRRELTEESAAIRSARERVSYNPVGVQIIEHRWRVLTTMPNKRQGWTPDGQSLEAGA